MKTALGVYICAFAFGVLGVFNLKSNILAQQKKIFEMQKKEEELKQTLRFLKIEWTHLNTPARLEKLNAKYLKLAPIQAKQLISPSSLRKKGIRS